MICEGRGWRQQSITSRCHERLATKNADPRNLVTRSRTLIFIGIGAFYVRPVVLQLTRFRPKFLACDMIEPKA